MQWEKEILIFQQNSKTQSAVFWEPGCFQDHANFTGGCKLSGQKGRWECRSALEGATGSRK